MAIRLTDARVGEERYRDFVISVEDAITDLTGIVVMLHKRKANTDGSFVTLKTDRDTSYLFFIDASIGHIRLKPYPGYWDTEGEDELFFEIVDNPMYFSPSSEMMLVTVKTGILKASAIIYVPAVTIDLSVIKPGVVIT